MNYNLEGQLALVTGAGQGIGKIDALTIARCGADVVVADINFEAAVETAKEIQSMGRKSKAYKMDVANFEQVQEVVKEIKSDMNRSISLLVNNAAKMNTMAQMKDMTYEMWQTDLNVNLTGTFNVTKAVWDDMRLQNYGRIVNMSSIAGIMGGFGQVVYSAAKAGVIGFTKSLALEGGKHNIRVNCMAPSFLKSPAWDTIPKEYQQRMEKKVPLQRVGETQEGANLVAFLLSDDSGYITGQCIPITGGADLFNF